MGLTGLEPVTPRLSSACSDQLSYRPGQGAALEAAGLEPATPCLQSRRSATELCPLWLSGRPRDAGALRPPRPGRGPLGAPGSTLPARSGPGSP